MKYVSLQVLLTQIILPHLEVFWGSVNPRVIPQLEVLRCSVVLVFFCLDYFLCAANYTSFTRNFKSIIGFHDRTTYKTVIKVIDSYLFIQKYIFGSNEPVHVCWIFKWFSNTFGLIFFPPPQKFQNLGREEGRAVLLMYFS